MTHPWLRTAMVGLAGATLAACATSQYPTAEGQAPRAPLTLPKANFPVSPGGAQAVLTPPQTAPTASAAPSGGTVQSQALPPVTGTTTAAPPTAVASQPLAPLAPATPPAPQLVTTTKTIPVAAGKVVDAEGKPQTYEVQGGDTLYAIARKLGTSVNRLAEDNDLSSPYRLSPGQTLKGPAPKTKAYTVMSGDTLYAIARRFSVRAQDIAEANEIALASPINVGQRLLLPAGYKDLGPSSRTITSTQPRFEPPAQVPIPATTTTLAATTPPPPPLISPPVARPIAPPVTTVASTTTVVPPASTVKPVTPAQATPKPYTPPVTTPVTPRPYTPPATLSPKPYTPPPASSTPPMIATGVPPTDMEVAAAGKGRFVWPVRGDVVLAFGPKGPGGQRNDGLNIRAASGSQVQAAAAGEVVYAGDQVPGFGNLVLIKHADNWVTAYAHLNRIDVKMRDRVMQGQSIGAVGSTGGVAEPQLHFEVRYAPSPKDKARPVDPTLVLPS